MATSPSTSDEPPALDRIPVQVDVVIGHVALRLEELATLRPGAVIELDRPVGTDVELSVGDNVLARGTLVSLEGQFAVKIAWTAS